MRVGPMLRSTLKFFPQCSGETSTAGNSEDSRADRFAVNICKHLNIVKHLPDWLGEVFGQGSSRWSFGFGAGD